MGQSGGGRGFSTHATLSDQRETYLLLFGQSRSGKGTHVIISISSNPVPFLFSAKASNDHNRKEKEEGGGGSPVHARALRRISRRTMTTVSPSFVEYRIHQSPLKQRNYFT